MDVSVLTKEQAIGQKERLVPLFNEYFNKIYSKSRKVDGQAFFDKIIGDVGSSVEIISFGSAGFIIMEIGHSEARQRKEAAVWFIFNVDESVDMDEVKQLPEQIAREKGADVLLFYTAQPLAIHRWLKKEGVEFVYGILKKELKK